MLRGTVACEATQPKVISSHTMRAARRHAARIAQEKRIATLEEQLNSWWQWWISDRSVFDQKIDDEILARLRAIAPSIRAQAKAQLRGQPHHSARSRLDKTTNVISNGAKHYFPDKQFDQVAAIEIKRNQRTRVPATKEEQSDGGSYPSLQA